MRGGGGDMLSGWRGTQAGGMYAPTTNQLRDETIVGKVYDNRVVRRLLTYIKPYKKDALLSLIAVLVYTAAQVGLPLVIMLWINWGINSGVGWSPGLRQTVKTLLTVRCKFIVADPGTDLGWACR